MRALPQWLVDAVLTDPYSMVPRVEWNPGAGDDWYPLRVISGSHSEDSKSQVRWNMSGIFASDYTVDELGIHPYGCRLKVFMDVRTVQNTYSIQYGEYVITKVTQNDDSISLSASSFEQEVIESEFIRPRRIPDKQFTSFLDQARTLITEAVPDARFVVDPDLKIPQESIPRTFYDGNRWEVVDGDSSAQSIMNACGGQCYCDFSGAFVFAPVSPINKPPVWTVDEDNVKVGTTSDLDRTGIHNVLTVAADSYTGDGAGPAFAWDKNPNSITYAGPDPVNHPGVGVGIYGLKPIKYSNTLINSDAMAQQVAESRINNYLGFRREVTFDSKFHPGLQAEDVVVTVAGGKVATYMLDSISYTWGDATVSCATRSIKAGDISDL